MKATYQQGAASKVVLIRLHPGCDLIEGIADVCRELGIESGCITSCIGSLRRASFLIAVPMANRIGAGYSDPITMEGPLELFSAQGNIGMDQEKNLFIHLHGVLGDRTANARGGHLIKGACPVLITCEVMVCLFDGLRLSHAYDPEVELKILSPVKNDQR